MITEVVEVCPHCDTENVFVWDVEEEGYKAFCPRCGKEMMLCDECMHADDNQGQACDWSGKDGCFRNRRNQ